MTDDKQKKGGVNPLGAAAVGVVVGAGAVIAGVAAMQNEENREKIKDAATKLKEGTEEKLDEGVEKVKKGMDSAEEAVDNKLDEVKTMVDEK